MYAAYLAKCASTTQNSNEWSALKRQAFINNPFCEYTPLGQDPAQIQNLDVCLDLPPKDQSVDIRNCQTNIANAYQALTINYLEMMAAHLNPKTFQKLQNDPVGISYNYATTHLQKALNRLSKISNISLKSDNPTSVFSGNIKDLGIIVNIINNTNATFRVSQGTTTSTPIAEISKGINGVNLYTAALYQETTGSSQTESAFYFYPVSGAANYQSSFTVGIYSGQDLINFLKTLPRKDQNIFDMNGCPTSEQYLANPTDLYMVLIQDPTGKGARERNSSQRIQAINLSVLTGPYLLTMQINETEIEQNVKIFQPAFTTVQVIQAPATGPTAAANSIKQSISNAAGATTPTMTSSSAIKGTTPILNSSLFPLIILPQFLWDIPALQMYWMLYSTSYIATLTDYSLFGPSKFGSAFNYYEDLGYFSTNYEYRFIIDRYNLLKTGQTLSDCPTLMSCAIFESRLEACNDIPSIYSSENSKNNIVGNNKAASYLNLFVAFQPKTEEKATAIFFNKYGFNQTYSMPYHLLYTLIVSLPITETAESFFTKVTQLQPNLYNLTWTDKEDTILNSQTMYVNFESIKIYINFLTSDKNWKGTTLLSDLKGEIVGKTNEFKVVYMYNSGTEKHSLEASSASPIDKIDYIHTIEFSQYPITELYYDLYQTFQVLPFIRCYMFQNGNTPSFLQSLSLQDWQNGVYLIPYVKNSEYLNEKNPGVFTVTFYKSDGKTILGTITQTEGLLNNKTSSKITEPVKIYNLYSNQFNPVIQAFLSSGILLKYN